MPKRKRERGPNVYKGPKPEPGITEGVAATDAPDQRKPDVMLEREVVPVCVESWARTFVRVLRLTGKVNSAARAAGRTVGHVYRTRARSDRFRKRWDDALAGHHEMRVDALKKEVYRRAVKGVRDPVVSQGRVVAYKRRYSDSLAARLLEAYEPETFGKHTASDVTVTVSLTSEALQESMRNPAYRRQICDEDARIASAPPQLVIDVTPPEG